jgi:hypothetical protein
VRLVFLFLSRKDDKKSDGFLIKMQTKNKKTIPKDEKRNIIKNSNKVLIFLQSHLKKQLIRSVIFKTH